MTHQRKHGSPLLSVVIPVYNVEEYLREALDSVRNQSFTDIEFIVINDGSEDESAEILNEFEKVDTRFRIFHQENAGLSSARNKGFDKATGKYIYFFDSDDVLVEDTFQKVIKRLENTTSDLAFFPILFIDEYGRTLPKKAVPMELALGSPLPGEQFIQLLDALKAYGTNVQRIIFKRSFLLKNNLRFDEGYIHEDEAFTPEAICLAERVISFKNPMLKKRIRPNSIMSEEIGIKNVEGWTQAISHMTGFLDKRDLAPQTQAIILKRARQLAHNSLNFLLGSKGPGSPTSSLDKYLRKEVLDKLGFLVYLHSKTQVGYRIIKKLKRILRSED